MRIKDGKIIECTNCGVEMYCQKFKLNQASHFCSLKCRDARSKKSLTCDYCGNKFLRLFCKIKKGENFCSHKCAARFASKANRIHRVWNEDKWDDGFLGCGGRFLVYYPKSSRILTGSPGYAFRYHVVYERRTGEKVPKNLLIHHINGNKTDDRFENLQLMTRAEHAQLHGKEYRKGKYLKCVICGSDFYRAGYRLRSGHAGLYCSAKCKNNRGTNKFQSNAI